jgi:hypothetical protein
MASACAGPLPGPGGGKVRNGRLKDDLDRSSKGHHHLSVLFDTAMQLDQVVETHG